VDAFGHFQLLFMFISGFVIRYYQMNSQTTRGEIAVFQTLFYIIFCSYYI